MTLINDPPPAPPASDPRRYGWPRPEFRHLIATLPDTTESRRRTRTEKWR